MSAKPGSIEVANLWKRFRSDRKRALIAEQATRVIGRLRGDHLTGWRWGLRDISFSVDPGEAVGIVGVNGSGKTTLLRLLSGVMFPYAGLVRAKGRIGAIIEIRAGIHPDLTGRENIAIYGTLLGLSRKTVNQRFDDIVQFAELEGAIDRQIKFYSTGMLMRLGFAVSAFLEPDILLVDEILAVGDASFQQRCLERMSTVLAQGTTLMFVSHDLAAVEATCNRVLWLDRGRLAGDGPGRKVLDDYRAAIEQVAEYTSPEGHGLRLIEVEVSGAKGDWPRTQEPLEIRAIIDGTSGERSSNLILGVSQGPAAPIFVLRHDLESRSSKTEVRCTISRLPLPRGRYYVWLGVYRAGEEILPWHPVAHFDVEGKELSAVPGSIVRLSPVHVEAAWELSSTNGAKPTQRAKPGPRKTKPARRGSRA